MKKEAPEYINIANHFFEYMKCGGEEKHADDVVVWTGYADYDNETEYVRADLVPRWHEVEYVLPPDGKDVVVYNGQEFAIASAKRLRNECLEWRCATDGYNVEEIFAWMEIPTFKHE